MNKENLIFVFGSNLAGRHGAGAAKFAKNNYGAIYGQGIGLQGKSYAIPTKDKNLKSLPLIEIEKYVKNFLEFSRKNPQLQFNVTDIGTGLAGYTYEQIGPFFKNHPSNVTLTHNFSQFI